MSEKITVKDFIEIGEEFFDKYYYVARELGEDPKPEEILKVMDALTSIVRYNRVNETKPVGFATEEKEEKPKGRLSDLDALD